MIEAPFGSASPMWSTAPSPGLALQTPIQAPAGFGSGAIGASALGPSGLFSGLGAIAPVAREMSSLAPMPTQTYLPATMMSPGLNLMAAFPFGASSPPPLVNPEPTMGVTAPALLGAVAMRRGQPQGPTNDQEVEDFIYDALEYLSGTADVEVRCESGRTTLTGSVHHKRVKHDAGEIAWAIPGVHDVQNNVSITSRRRARASRETETATVPTRK